MKSFLSFFTAMLSTRHIPSLLIFGMNFCILVVIVHLCMPEHHPLIIFFVSAALTLTALAVVVSPVGDWWVLKTLDTKMYKAENTNVADRVLPLFESVKREARRQEPEISEHVKLYISAEEDINAYAIGRRIVCLTYGAVQACDDDVLKALLGHEFGHLSQRDSEASMMIYVGMMPLGTIETVTRFFTFILVVQFFYYLFLFPFCWVLKHLVRLLRSIGSKAAENGADAFSVRLGHGYALRYFMQAISYSEGKRSLLDSIFASHPASADRLEHIDHLLGLR